MFEFVFENLPTILVGTIVFSVIGAVCVKLILDFKHHRSTCGCGCAKCPNSGSCHSK